MVKVSIVSLIYQSTKLADWVYESVHRFTPMIAQGSAEFLFVANDPTPGLVRHLEDRRYPYVINENVRYSEEELFALGFGKPEYMSRVYRGYNVGVRRAKGDYVVLINSDNYFSADWLENLLKYSDRSRVISCKLVERYHPIFGVFPGAAHGEFGGTVDSFDEGAFLSFVGRTKKTGLEQGGAYMPALFHRDIAIEAGLYPCGNIAGKTFDEVIRYGDESFFDALASLGVSHYTALDSMSYHLKEGERADTDELPDDEIVVREGTDLVDTDRTPIPAWRDGPAIDQVRDSMAPSKRHELLMSLIVADPADSPATRTLRQVVASGVLTPDQEKRARAELANPGAGQRHAESEMRLEEQGQSFRAYLERRLGLKRADLALRAIHSVSWLTRPARRAWVSRRRRTK